MKKQWFTFLFLCIMQYPTEFTLALRADQDQPAYIEYFDELQDTGIRETDPEARAMQKMPGCEYARKVSNGKYGNVKLYYWDCIRCNRGYYEKFIEMNLKEQINQTILQKGRTAKWFKRVCIWNPCGMFCDTCAIKSPWFSVYNSIITCIDCRKLDGTFIRQDVNVQASSPEGTQVLIQQICGIRLHAGNKPAALTDKKTTAESLLVALFNMLLIPCYSGLTTGEQNPFELIQRLDSFKRHVTVEYLASMDQNTQKRSPDMVEKGTRYMQQVIDRALGKFDAQSLLQLGHVMAYSRTIADLHSSFALCIAIGFENIGIKQENDDKLGMATKNCDSDDNALTRVQNAVLNLSKVHAGHKLETTVFESLDKAPRFALDVLTMFGVID